MILKHTELEVSGFRQSLLRSPARSIDLIDDLHVTSWRPCWCTGTKRFISSGRCKLRKKFSFVLYTNMAAIQTSYSPCMLITHYKQYDILRRVDPLSFGGKECMPAWIAHFENEWWPGSRVTAQAIVGLFGRPLNAMIIANVPPNLPTIAWAATLDPGYHSFSKWAVRPILKETTL